MYGLLDEAISVPSASNNPKSREPAARCAFSIAVMPCPATRYSAWLVVVPSKSCVTVPSSDPMGSESSGRPKPDNGTRATGVTSLSVVISSVVVRVPAVMGEKLTLTLADSPDASVFPLTRSAAMEKSAAFAPARAMPVTARLAPPVLVTVNSCATEGTPRSDIVKSWEEGLTLAAAERV